MLKRVIWVFGMMGILCACSRPWTAKSVPTPDSVWTTGSYPASRPPSVTATLSYSIPPSRQAGDPLLSPTPDPAHVVNEAPASSDAYIVQAGDTVGGIAERYSVSIETIVLANNLINPDSLEVGQSLFIPSVSPQMPGPAYKLVPDSELVYGPNCEALDIAEFIENKAGYLAQFTQNVNGELMNAAQIIERIARDYSVCPRLLLALLEYRSGWVTNPTPDAALGETPFGFIDGWYLGLYRQLAWVAIQLNNGFYRWQENRTAKWVLADGSVVPIDSTINAGTAGVQNYFAQIDDYQGWLRDVSPGGIFDTYYVLFGYPFDVAIEPLVPTDLTQPILTLPFAAGEIWAFTGGPHLAWDAGTPFGALDFAPPGEALGCVESNNWVTAVADGLVTNSGDGKVTLDLDDDGNEGSGWVIQYMHIESRDRVQRGTFLREGEPVGHPSCEGGISSGTHVHISRKFNGVWIAADGVVPFTLSGWFPSGTGEEYVGSLTRNEKIVESFEGNNPVNQIQR